MISPVCCHGYNVCIILHISLQTRLEVSDFLRRICHAQEPFPAWRRGCQGGARLVKALRRPPLYCQACAPKHYYDEATCVHRLMWCYNEAQTTHWAAHVRDVRPEARLEGSSVTTPVWDDLYKCTRATHVSWRKLGPQLKLQVLVVDAGIMKEVYAPAWGRVGPMKETRDDISKSLFGLLGDGYRSISRHNCVQFS